MRARSTERQEINEAADVQAADAAGDEHEAWCLSFYGPHTHSDTEPFRVTSRGPWYPANMDFPGIETQDSFEAGSREPVIEDDPVEYWADLLP